MQNAHQNALSFLASHSEHPPKNLITTGQKQRLGRKAKGSPVYWCRETNGGLLVNYSTFRHGGYTESAFFKFDSNDYTPTISPLKQLKLAQAAEASELKSATEEARKQSNFNKLKFTYTHAPTNGENPYLIKKHVQQYATACKALRYAGNDLLVGIQNVHDELIAIQTINDNKIIRGKLKGGLVHIGEPLGHGVKVYIVEGLATALSVYAACGGCVICALSASNLSAVKDALNSVYNDLIFIFCADNDAWDKQGKLKSADKNTGIQVCNALAKADPNSFICHAPTATGCCDINDLHVSKGLDYVRNILSDYTPKIYKDSNELSAKEATAKLNKAIAMTGENLAIKASAGLGKTTAIINHSIRTNLPAVIMLPTHDLMDELISKNPDVSINAIKSRSGTDKDGCKLCPKNEAFKALQAGGLGHKASEILCGTVKNRTCWHYKRNQCGYFKQFEEPALITLVTHNYLTIKTSKINKISLKKRIIIDESPFSVFDDMVAWDFATLYEYNGIYRAVAVAIESGEPLPLQAELEAELINLSEKISLVHPDVETLSSSKQYKTEVLKNIEYFIDHDLNLKKTKELWKKEKLINICLKILSNDAHANQLFYTKSEGKIPPKIRYTGRKKLADWCQLAVEENRVMLIDASLDEAKAKAVFSTKTINISARLNVHVTQVTDTALSGKRLNDNKRGLAQRITTFAKLSNAAIISSKTFETAHCTDIKQTAHFGGLRGLDRMRNENALIIVGRSQKPSYVYEIAARIWNPTEFKQGTYNVKTAAFDNAAVDHELQHSRSEETIQAVNRLRLIHCNKQKHVFILSNADLMDFQIDQKLKINDLLPPQRFVEILEKTGGFIMSAKMLLDKYPSFYNNILTAKRDITAIKKQIVSVSFAYKYIYREMILKHSAQGRASKVDCIFLSADEIKQNNYVATHAPEFELPNIIEPEPIEPINQVFRHGKNVFSSISRRKAQNYYDNLAPDECFAAARGLTIEYARMR